MWKYGNGEAEGAERSLWKVIWFSFEGVLGGSTEDGEWVLCIEETARGSIWVL